MRNKGLLPAMLSNPPEMLPLKLTPDVSFWVIVARDGKDTFPEKLSNPRLPNVTDALGTVKATGFVIFACKVLCKVPATRLRVPPPKAEAFTKVRVPWLSVVPPV